MQRFYSEGFALPSSASMIDDDGLMNGERQILSFLFPFSISSFFFFLATTPQHASTTRQHHNTMQCLFFFLGQAHMDMHMGTMDRNIVIIRGLQFSHFHVLRLYAIIIIVQVLYLLPIQRIRIRSSSSTAAVVVVVVAFPCCMQQRRGMGNAK
jgi:hypothetical protein